MTRLPRQAEQQIEQRLSNIRTAINDIRTAQSFDSSDVRAYRIYNAAGSDITFTNVTATTPRCAEVTLTPNSVVSNAAIAFDTAFSFSSTSNSGDSVDFRFDPLPPVAGVQKFRLYVMGHGVTFRNLTIGFSFWTISPGSFTVQEVAP